MFYSHTFLARKGPLGTVWCAAHLQHKLKKSHYTSTNIPSTVERIMYPEVPIALRMSGHLLLGVVRIYSKQVDYLYQDCNGVLIGISKAFTSVNINLPEDATQAPFHSITLPERFELDALELEDDYFLERCQDNHLKLREEITLEDQVPTGTDPYIIITFDEDNRRGSPVLQDASGSGVRPIEEDSRPSFPEGTTAMMGDPSPSNQAEFNEKTIGDGTIEEIPEIEIMRDFRMEDGLTLPDHGNDIMEPDRVLEEQIMKDKEVKSPVLEEMLSPGGPAIPVRHPEGQQSVASEEPHESLDLRMDLGHATPELALRATPPVEQPRAKQRKRRRQFFDEATVLTNKFMKKALEDSHDLMRKKRNCPASNLDAWRLNNRLKKDLMFFEPSIAGLSADLHSVYKKEVISSKTHLITSEEAHPEREVMQSPTGRGHKGVEIECLRNYEGPTGGSSMFEILPSPNRFVSSPIMFVPSPIGRDEATPSTMNFGADTDRFETTFGTEVLPTPDMAPSSGLFGSDTETSATLLRHAPGVEDSVLSDIPEMANSAGDLSFLEQDDNTPVVSQGTPEPDQLTRNQKGTQEFDKLSARTRAVAQYLKRQLSVTPSSEDLSGSFSLNSILEGKSRKICARMFTEMLVLKNCELVDVNQEEFYGDITLKVTSKLSKEQFSS